MSQREEFVSLVGTQAVSFAELCRRFGVSRRTGYKWLERFQADGPAGLTDRSRRPLRSPTRTPPETEQAVLAVRAAHPAWGGRKIRRVLLNQGRRDPPAASTITMILQRHGLIDALESARRQAWTRFEHPRPNDLWQMDFKGHFAMQRRRCHPLTVLDDHSRYCIGLQACGDQRGTTVRQRLTTMFQRYGLPRRMLMDNGAPWSGHNEHHWTPLTVWLLRLGIDVSHGRPYHPQTQGKDERFHRTIQTEVLNRRRFDDLDDCQRGFDRWRRTYNHQRPHEALELDTPAQHYRPSRWSFSSVSDGPVEYAPDDVVRTIQLGGILHFRNAEFRVGKAFHRQRVALRPTTQDGVWDVVFCCTRIARIDVRDRSSDRLTYAEAKAGGGTSSAGSPEPPPWASFPSQGQDTRSRTTT